MSKQLSHIIYVSRACSLMRQHELLEILTTARSKNATLSVTGMLLYKDQSFMQVLEGSVSAVNEVYSAIKRDRRHCRVKLLVHEAIDTRDFSSWTMGFQNLDKSNLSSIQGFSNFFESQYEAQKTTNMATRALDFLRYFRNAS